MPCLTHNWWPILFQHHFCERRLPLGVSRYLLGMRYSCNAFSNLLHFNLNDLVLEVNAFLLNLGVQDVYRLWFTVSNCLLF